MTCALCQRIEHQQNVLFSTDRVVILIPEKQATLGHVELVPREHVPIMEQLAPETMAELFILANNVSIGLFEALGVRGTNLFIRNGLGGGQSFPHFSVDVFARTPEDGIQLTWKNKELGQEQLEHLRNQLLSPSAPSDEVSPETQANTYDHYVQALRRLP